MCINRILTFPVLAITAGFLTMAATGRSVASPDPTAAAATCIREGAGIDVDEFTKCWIVNMMSDDQKRVGHCIAVNKGLGRAAFCMSGMQLSPFGLEVAKCAQRNRGDTRAIAGCVGMPALPPEAQRLAACVAANPQNFWGAALCAGGHELTPEQTVFANCAVATGMQPHDMALCIGGQLVMDELHKCLTAPRGGVSCFGDNEAITLLACEAWRGMAEDVNPARSQPAQIFGGPNSVFNKPGHLAAGPSSAIHNPGQLAGGSNSVARNPDPVPGAATTLAPKSLAVRF